MAISRSLMNRQLRASGGIMDVTPRENFGIGSSLKKFVRKIIPNEVADIAVKAAPFVAPFNPALAGVMGGLGSFDQTGSISAGLKSGALNYGGGQLARYAGGAGFQGNPFGTGGAFTQGGFQGGFSSPFGTQTGIGKMLNKPIEGVGVDSGRGGTSASALSRSTANVPGAEAVNITPTNLNDYVGTAADIIPTNLNDYVGTAADIIPTNLNDYASMNKDTILQNNPGVFNSITNSIKNFDYKGLGEKTLELGKKFGKAAFTDKDGNIDKAAVMGAIAFAGSYAEALALADDAGVELTEEQYDEATKAEKKEEYSGYLTNFFGGKKDGGRIGFEGGANELIKDKLMEDIMPDTSTEEMIMIMTEDGPKMVKKSDLEAMPGMFRDTTTSLYGDAARGRPVPEFANGGRINRRFGSPEEGEGDGLMEMLSVDVDAGGDDEEENMMMAYSDAIFDRREKSALFRSLGDPRMQQTTKSFKDLDKILKNPGMFPEDEFMLREYLKLKGFKDGGRIGLKDGTDKSMLEKLLNSKIAQEGRYGASEFFFGDPIMFGTPDKFKDGKNDNRGTFKRDPSDYDKLSPEKQAYIEAFLNSDEGQLFLKPGKIKFPTDEKMIEHNKKITLEDFNEDRNPLETLLGIDYENRAKGGRIGYKGGANRVSELLILRDSLLANGEDVSDIEAEIFQLTGKAFKSVGGISDIPTGQMRKNNAGVVERDYRDEGGFVPVGIKERADDVPAMLSKNEFVMTADAVRGIGNGSVEEGSKKLYNTMKQAEQVGKA